jgi:hypothetical protein
MEALAVVRSLAEEHDQVDDSEKEARCYERGIKFIDDMRDWFEARTAKDNTK